MSRKESSWVIITACITCSLFIFWAVYEYQKDPSVIPFEPLIGVATNVLAIIGFWLWSTKSSTSTSQSDQTIKTGIIDSASVEVANQSDADESIRQTIEIEEVKRSKSTTLSNRKTE